ncbi:hypothetical protein FAGAP_13119 [Fusarium agapanthi]|uniref:Uncharacterized protein n=1 Tax=Fusarium agapanthi TaxID=1803897 RepID=A0A9P5AWG7_9HYPO|nr:hypothetical protein FAGAP_13119 [Fusarium agapanthi]
MTSEDPTNDFIITNDEDRPEIKPAATFKNPAFRINDKVNLLLPNGTVDPHGPYLVASVILPDKCTLCDSNTYESAKGGATIDMAVLEKAAA